MQAILLFTSLAGASASAQTAASDAGVAAVPGLRLYWVMVGDQNSGVEIDDPDLHVSAFASREALLTALRSCEQATPIKLVTRRPNLRMLRIERASTDGKIVESHCQLSLKRFRKRLGEPLIDRLEDELDAHQSFLTPRHFPIPAPPKTDSK